MECRNECRPDDLMLLTKEPMQLESGVPLRPPALHILALVEKVESSHERKGEKTVVGHVNLLSGAAGSSSQDVLQLSLPVSRLFFEEQRKEQGTLFKTLGAFPMRAVQRTHN